MANSPLFSAVVPSWPGSPDPKAPIYTIEKNICLYLKDFYGYEKGIYAYFIIKIFYFGYYFHAPRLL